jgi:hypothetical protein
MIKVRIEADFFSANKKSQEILRQVRQRHFNRGKKGSLFHSFDY